MLTFPAENSSLNIMSATLKWVLGSILVIIVALRNNEAILSTSYKDLDHLCYGGERDEARKYNHGNNCL